MKRFGDLGPGDKIYFLNTEDGSISRTEELDDMISPEEYEEEGWRLVDTVEGGSYVLPKERAFMFYTYLHTIVSDSGCLRMFGRMVRRKFKYEKAN